MDINQQQKEAAALEVLRSTGNDILEAALIARETLKSNRGNALRARKCIAAGAEELKKQERTVSFEKAAAFALEERRVRQVRTVYDFRYFTRRFMKRCPGLARRKVRAIYILPQHSKTGGARRVMIHKPLLRILRTHRRADGEKICPPDWLHHWRELRRAAGWDSPAQFWAA